MKRATAEAQIRAELEAAPNGSVDVPTLFGKLAASESMIRSILKRWEADGTLKTGRYHKRVGTSWGRAGTSVTVKTWSLR